MLPIGARRLLKFCGSDGFSRDAFCSPPHAISDAGRAFGNHAHVVVHGHGDGPLKRDGHGLTRSLPAGDHDRQRLTGNLPRTQWRSLRLYSRQRCQHDTQIEQCAGNDGRHQFRVAIGGHGVLYLGRAKATSAVSSPRPVAITTICLPCESRYVIGVAVACLGKT